MKMLEKLQWGTLIGGLCIGAVFTGAAWEGTHLATKDGPVIATVGGKPIHQAQFDNNIAQTVGPSALTNLIEQQLIDDAAKKDGIYPTVSEVNKLKQSIEAQNGITSDSQLKSVLSRNGMTMAQFNDQLKTDVLAQKVAEHNVHVTSAEIQNYYNSNRASFKTQPTVRLAGIATKTKTAAETAESLLQQGKSFAQVAKSVSIDKATAAKGGAMGSFTKPQLTPALASIVFNLAVGKVSQPVNTGAGWMIVKVTARKPAVVEPLQSVKSQIVQDIKQQNAVSPTQLLADLAKTDKIVISNPAYAKVKTTIENPPATARP